MSGYCEQQIGSSMINQPDYTYETTLGAIADAWSSDPPEWGACIDEDWNREALARFVYSDLDEFALELWEGYEDENGYIQNDTWSARTTVNTEDVLTVVLTTS